MNKRIAVRFGLFMLAGILAMSVFVSTAGAGVQDTPDPETEVAAATDADAPEEDVSWIRQLEMDADALAGDVNAAIESVLFFPIWKFPFVVLWLVVGSLIFTIMMGFINFKMFRHAIDCVRGRYTDPSAAGEVSHFQALTSALSATVGLGNIGGVAIAIMLGGPGATFWMICAGLLGMTTKFVECTLGQMYRKVDAEGRVSGGPMHYLFEGLRAQNKGGLGKLLAGFFMLLCIGASFGGGNMFQVNQSLGAVSYTIPELVDYGWIYGLIMATAVGLVIIGGIKRIAQTAEKIVPLMCSIYVIAALVILIKHAGDIPGAFGDIIGGAFTPEAGLGGMVGVLVVGFQRAAFSNEAGAGSASIAHSAAKTDEPVREGVVALLEPFIDTVIVCTMSALVIVITGAYNNPDPEFAAAVADKQGATLTSLAFESEISFFPWILAVAVTLFAFSTIITWSYYGERCWTHLFGPNASIYYKVIYIVFVFFGAIVSATNVLAFSDLMILGMALPNICGLYFLAPQVKVALQEYQQKLASGAFKVFK